MADTSLIIPATLTPVAVFGEAGGVDAVLANLRRDAIKQAEGLDITTERGRSLIASVAYKVARSKTALDDMGKQLVSDWKQRAAKVDEERRHIREECDSLRDEIRKPLDEYEAEVAAFNAKWKGLCVELEALGDGTEALSTAEIKTRQARLSELAALEWPIAYKAMGEKVGRAAKALLEQALRAAEQRDADEAERRRIAAEEAARAQREREERIAAEAAAKAKAEAEAAAAHERVRVERKEAEAAAKLQREKDRREADAKAAKERLEREKEAAAERERIRIAKEQEREREAAERRAANERNQRKARSDIIKSLTALGYTQSIAERLADDLIAGKVARVTVQW